MLNRVVNSVVIVLSLSSAVLCGTTIVKAQGAIDQKSNVNSKALLPEPLGSVVTVLGPFEPSFDIEKTEFFKVGEFQTPDPMPRTVKEETIVWTLVARRDLSVDELRKLLNRPRGQPLPSVSFVNSRGEAIPALEVGSKSSESGYALFPYWHRKELAKGDQLRIWTHLGKSGTSELVKSGAAKAVFDDTGASKKKSP